MSENPTVNGQNFQTLRVATPAPPGMQSIQNVNGSFVAVAPDGTTSAIGGGASPANLWYQYSAQLGYSKVNTLTTAIYTHEFWIQDAYLELGVAVGTGAVTFLTTAPGGIAKCSSGATANSARILRSVGAQTNAPIPNLRTSKYSLSTLVRFSAVPATFTINACDLSDGLTGDTFLGAIQTASGTNWAFKIGSGANTDTGVAFNTNWNTLTQIGDGTNVFFYVGNQAGSTATLIGSASQSTAPNNPGYWQILAQNLGTAANCEVEIDKVLLMVESPTNAQ